MKARPASSGRGFRAWSSPCHSRATSGGQARYGEDNHGQFHSVDELVPQRSSCLNASRKYA